MDDAQNISNAINAYRNHDYPSIRATARAYRLTDKRLRNYLNGGVSRATSHVSQQYLSTPEEETLVKWIIRLDRLGHAISPALTRTLAFEIRDSRPKLSSSTPTPITPTPLPGKNWTQKLRTRYPNIRGAYTRSLESARVVGSSYSIVEAYFDALSTLFLENSYLPDDVYNFDESGFAIGTSISTRVLTNTNEKRPRKVVPGRQEWITAIECISALGRALPPLIIYKGEYTNTRWIPTSTPLNWRFTTSRKGWTLDTLGYEWLISIFEPETRPSTPRRRLLVTDGHSSHLTAKFIAFCLENTIDLIVLPPHSSHYLQPLDIAIFSPLKTHLAAETDRLSRLDSGRISKVDWTRAYITAHQNAFIPQSILAGFRKAGLSPFSPITILSNPEMFDITPDTLYTPTTPKRDKSALETTLLASSPPDGTDIRRANEELLETVQEATNLPSPAKRYIRRLTSTLEKSNSERTLLRKENKEQRELLERRKERTKGKRIAIKGKFVFNTREILEIVEKAEAEASTKKSRKRRRTTSPPLEIEDEEDKDIENLESEEESDCIIVASRR
jgi:hypothetical protein